jgi:hypothetical protein
MSLKKSKDPTRDSSTYAPKGDGGFGRIRPSSRKREPGLATVELLPTGIGAYSFLDIGDGVDLQELVNLLEAARGRGAAAPD